MPNICRTRVGTSRRCHDRWNKLISKSSSSRGSDKLRCCLRGDIVIGVREAEGGRRLPGPRHSPAAGALDGQVVVIAPPVLEPAGHDAEEAALPPRLPPAVAHDPVTQAGGGSSESLVRYHGSRLTGENKAAAQIHERRQVCSHAGSGDMLLMWGSAGNWLRY